VIDIDEYDRSPLPEGTAAIIAFLMGLLLLVILAIWGLTWVYSETHSERELTSVGYCQAVGLTIDECGDDRLNVAGKFYLFGGDL